MFLSQLLKQKGHVMRVVVYENSQDRAKLIRDLLSTYRYKTFLNTDQPLPPEKIKDIKPTLIIVNVNNPSHIELLEKLKKNKYASEIPIILISSLGSREILDKFQYLPYVDYLVEPFKIKNFRHLVERWITFRSMYIN
jgi:DNA-binding response OmpR family regulator